MLISKIFSRIRKYIDISKSIHLSNDEEKKITIEIVHQLKRLLRLILSKDEKEQYKVRLKLIKQPKELTQIKNYLNKNNQHFNWFRLLSLKSNYLLRINADYKITVESIYNDFINKLYKSSQITNDNYYYLEAPESKSAHDVSEYFNQIQAIIIKRKLSNIIIPSHCITSLGKIKDEIAMEYTTSLISGSIIIDITNSKHFNVSVKYLNRIIQNNSKIKYGLSFETTSRETVYCINSVLKELSDDQKKSFLLRINKSNLSSDSIEFMTKPIKNNTYYKWSIFTIMNLIRKHNIKCIINSNNLYDIAWIQLSKSQLNIENMIIFETNRTKFPNIAKLIQVLNKSSIHSEIILISKSTKIKLTIIIEKLLLQHSIYKEFKNSNFNEELIFKKSHEQFFNYLQHNYLEKYLNHYSKKYNYQGKI